MAEHKRHMPASGWVWSAPLVGVIAVTILLGHGPDANAAESGTLLWSKRYDGPAHLVDVGSAIAASPDGTKVFITGTSRGDSIDYATVAHEASTGTGLWVRRYDGPVQGIDEAMDIAVSTDGARVFVTGRSQARSGDGWATIAYDSSTGSMLWSRRHRGVPVAGATALEVSPDGSKVFVVGSAPDGNSSDYATLAYDARTGATIWARRYDGPAGLEDNALAVFAAAGRVFVTGWSVGFDATLADYATIAYRATTGRRFWVRHYDGPAHGYDFANTVVASTDGSRVFVTGDSADREQTTDDFATLAYDGSTGKRLWVRRFGTVGRSSAFAADAPGDGSRVYVTGISETAATGGDAATIAYDGATGSRLWVNRYTGPGAHFDNSESIVVNPAATAVYVTGVSDRGSGTGGDVLTLAYDASTGSTEWSRFFTSADGHFDSGHSVDVSPDGSQVFVGGHMNSARADYLTLAFAA